MDRSRVRIAAVMVPALIVGALLGDWMGRQLFPVPPAPASTADGPTQLTLVFPPVLSSGPTAAQASPAPGQSLSPLLSPPPGDPGGVPGGGGANPPPPSSPRPTGAATTAAPPPPPAWGTQLNTSLQVLASYPTGGTQQVGRAEGWVQLHTDRTKFRYSFTFCRQSSYMLPYMAVAVNGHYVGQTWQSTPITTINPSYGGNSGAQPCYGSTATVSNEHGYSTIQNVYLKIFGSTFLGSEHVVFNQDRTFYN